MKLDQLQLVTAPLARDGWRDFEGAPLPLCADGMRAHLPQLGRFEWHGWGAVELNGTAGSRATFRAFHGLAAGVPKAIRLRGCLDPEDGTWEAHVAGKGLTLTPGPDDKTAVEWVVPLAGVALPGALEIDITCTAAPEEGVLSLDAWKLEF